MHAFFDAAFADTADCKSTAGWLAFVNGSLIAYDSTTIKRVVSSSTEAECNAMAILAKENTWHRRLYSEIFNTTELPPTMVYGDNSASLMMLEAGVTKRSRHFAIEWFLVHDRVDEGELKVEWVPTEANLADFFTKKLPRARFTELRNAIMNCEEPVVANMLRFNSDESEEFLIDDTCFDMNSDSWMGYQPLPENYEFSLLHCDGDYMNGGSVTVRLLDAANEEVPEELEGPDVNVASMTPIPLPRAMPLSGAMAPTPLEEEVKAPPLAPSSVECKEVYPMLNFMSRLKLPKQLKPTHGRMVRDTDGMKMFIVTFLNTVHYEMQRDSTSWYFVAGTKGVAHLAMWVGDHEVNR